jgi:hypothetical protein
MISVIYPSRSRPQIALSNWEAWFGNRSYQDTDWILSLDEDDNSKYEAYFDTTPIKIIRNKNRSCVDAINNAAKIAKYDIFMVISDDTYCSYSGWDAMITDEVKDKTDWILKTQDGIQPWIITMPVMDRTYYNRFGYIYHPGYEHQFCDTYMSCVADITGRRITSNLKFTHLNDTIKDDLRKRTDATWKQGEELFIKLMKEFSPEERSRIQDQGMKNWLRNKGVR